MQKVLLVLASLCLFNLSLTAQNVNIPDANFKAYLVGNTSINTNQDTEISVTEAANVTGILNVRQKNIADLTGVEAFVNISELDCRTNQISTLDISAITNLDRLNASSNQLTSLDVSSNTVLTYLVLDNNNLDSLILTNNPSISWLSLKNNNLTSLDISPITSLFLVSINGNNITSIDASQNAQLRYLYCNDNQLTSMNLKNVSGSLTNLVTIGNPNLLCIEVDDTAASAAQFTPPLKIDPITSFSNNCSCSDYSKIDDIACQGTTYTFPDGSSATVSAKITHKSKYQNVNSCDSVIVTVLDVSSSYNLVDSTTICSGESFTFADGTTQNNITSQIVYTSNLQTQAASCDSIITTTVKVNQLIDNSTSTTMDTIVANQMGATYQWLDCNNNNSPIAGATAMSYKPTSSGDYAVEITLNNCVDTSACVAMVVTAVEYIKNAAVKIFPNPTKNQLNIAGVDNIEQISIIHVNGLLLRTFKSKTKQVDVSNLPKGVYILRITTSDDIIHSPFLKE